MNTQLPPSSLCLSLFIVSGPSWGLRRVRPSRRKDVEPAITGATAPTTTAVVVPPFLPGSVVVFSFTPRTRASSGGGDP